MPVVNTSLDSIETILPRLGDYLLDEGLITAEGLQQALDYQKSQQAAGQPLLLGQALLVMNLVDPKLLDKAITRQILDLHTVLQKNNQQLEERVNLRTHDLERRLLEIRTAAEITQFAISAASLDEVLKRTVNLIVDRFGYYSASIFLVDQTGKNLILADAAGPFSLSVKQKGQVIQVGSRSMVGWVAANNQPRISADVRQEFFYHIDDLLTDTLSEASIPISIGSFDVDLHGTGDEKTALDSGASGKVQIIGVLDVQHNIADAFDSDVVAVLQTIANHIASVIQNINLIEASRQRLRETAILYNASHRLSRAKSVMDVYSALGRTLEESPFPAAFFIAHGNEMRPLTLRTEKQIARKTIESEENEQAVSSLITRAQIEAIFPAGTNLLVIDLKQPGTYPQPILTLLQNMASNSIALIPIHQAEQLTGLIILGIQSEIRINTLSDGNDAGSSLPLDMDPAGASSLQSYVGLAELTETALDKVHAVSIIERRLDALQALNSISQLISAQTDIQELYCRIHSEIMCLMGNIDFMIAIYDTQADTIQIPYLVEMDPQNGDVHLNSVHPFPLGKGLTSIIINTRQPLMINFDTEEKSRELGAIVLGQPAKSWLGVPLLFAGESLGAIIVQDREKEGRFTQDDLRLLETLAVQVSVSIHNAHLLENTSRQAERARLLYEITSKIRNSTDMHTILRITAMELQKVYKAHNVKIEIDIDAALQSTAFHSKPPNQL